MLSCAAFCQAALSISGLDNFCYDGATYSIPGLPAGTTVAWQLTGTNAATQTAGSGPAFTTVYNGATPSSGTLTATLTSECGEIILTKRLGAGYGLLVNISMSSYTSNNFCTYTASNGNVYPGYVTWTAQLNGAFGAYVYEWYALEFGSGAWVLKQSGGSSTFSACIGNSPACIRVIVRTYGNSCTGSTAQAELCNNAPHRTSTVYPNPAVAYTEVAADASATSADRTATQPMLVTVYNVQGIMVSESVAQHRRQGAYGYAGLAQWPVPGNCSARQHAYQRATERTALALALRSSKSPAPTGRAFLCPTPRPKPPPRRPRP